MEILRRDAVVVCRGSRIACAERTTVNTNACIRSIPEWETRRYRGLLNIGRACEVLNKRLGKLCPLIWLLIFDIWKIDIGCHQDVLG